ncbi:MAG: paraquat-inducible protein B [Paraglaciecola sp.]|jgi:paraquat-inducible protein B
MNDSSVQPQAEAQPADIKPVRSISKIWLVPLVALSIGLWMIYYQWSNQGPLITIQFENAEGLEAGKTKIKTRNVDIGQVKRIELSPDLKGVLVTARLDLNHEHLLHEGSKFWIVTPRISLNGVSGLGTLLSGPYINMEAGEIGEETTQFVALSAPPVTPAGTPGLHVTLNSNDEFAFKEGDPVIYKGLKVGEFENIYFNFDERVVYYNTFIQAPYHKLITENTKFWDSSGIRMELGADGVKVSTGSIETLLTNGVTFGIPEGMPHGEQITKRTFFDIHSSYESAAEERYKLSAEYLILVSDTIRGLQIGAPVEYRGLVIGKVLDINPQELAQDSLLEKGYTIPVVISIQPGRVQQPDNQVGLEFVRKQTSHWIDNGLRASLKTGSLLTGALFVDLQNYPDAEPVIANTLLGYDVIPTITNEFAQITAKVNAILDNINQLQLQKLAGNANDMLQQISTAAKSLQDTASNIDNLLISAHQGQLSASISKALESVTKLTSDFSAGSDNYDEMNATMMLLQGTLKDLQPILLQLNSTPNSLIFVDGSGIRLEPKGKSSQAPQGDQ